MHTVSIFWSWWVFLCTSQLDTLNRSTWEIILKFVDNQVYLLMVLLYAINKKYTTIVLSLFSKILMRQSTNIGRATAEPYTLYVQQTTAIAEKKVRLFLSSKAVVSSKPVKKPSSISSKTVVFSDNLSSIVVVSAIVVAAIAVVCCILQKNRRQSSCVICVFLSKISC